MSPALDNKKSMNTPTAAASKKTAAKRKVVPGAKKIVNEILPGFSRQLAAMLSAGMPIVATLDALHDQTDNPNFKSVISRLKASIENGSAFSDALRQFPSIFDDLYANMVQGGEMGGQLAETIGRLAVLDSLGCIGDDAPGHNATGCPRYDFKCLEDRYTASDKLSEGTREASRGNFLAQIAKNRCFQQHLIKRIGTSGCGLPALEEEDQHDNRDHDVDSILLEKPA